MPVYRKDTRKMPTSLKETSGQVTFPLPYEACNSSANMALTGLPGRRRIGREGGILHNKKRYPSKLCLLTLHLDSLAAAAHLRCRGLPRRVTKNGCLIALRLPLWDSERRSSLFITSGFAAAYGGSSRFRRCFCCPLLRRAKAVISIPFFGQIIETKSMER